MVKKNRKMVKIDEEKCNGCGLCVPSCAEGALQIVDGKAKLVSDVYCDGLGACLGDCPEGAITIEEREAEEFDEAAVEKRLAGLKKEEAKPAIAGGCPGSALKSFRAKGADDKEKSFSAPLKSWLTQWPVQLMLVPEQAPYLKEAELVICADCVPFALADLHQKYLKGKTILVGCPKLDDLKYYQQKLTEIFKVARPKSITVTKMEVPCCSGIAQVTIAARDAAQLKVEVSVDTVGIEGGISSEKF